MSARIISATNADLRAEVGAGHFREDLLFRLNTVEIHVPALRNRREDIPPLAAHFLKQHSIRYRKQLSGFETDAMQQLLHALLAGQYPRARPRGGTRRADGGR